MIRLNPPALLADVMDGFRGAPGRVAIIAMALFLGSSSMALLLAAIGGLNLQARDLMRDFGVHVFTISVDTAARSQAHLTIEHVETIRQSMPGRRVSLSNRHDVPVGDVGRSVVVWQTDEHMAGLRGWTMKSGSFFDVHDMDRMSRHAIVSPGLAHRWGLQVGSVIRLKQTPYDVIGILSSGSGLNARHVDDAGALIMADELAVYVPWSTPAPWLSGARRWDHVETIYVRAADNASLRQDIAFCRAILESDPALKDKLLWTTPEQLLGRIRRLQQIIYWTLGSVTVLCLVMGGTILFSVMTANVRERIPEIGLRRAMGASRVEISGLFVTEALLLTIAASLVAIVMVHAGLLLARHHLPMPVAFGLNTWLVPVLISSAVGTLFSYYPARMAARIAPAEALRND